MVKAQLLVREQRASIGRIGPAAARVLAPGMRGRVLAVFRRSFYVEADSGALACIGRTEIGAGPLNALHANDAAIGTIAIGQPVSVADDAIRIDGAPVLAMDDAAPWRPRPWMRDAAPDALRAGLRAAAAAAPRLAPDDGLAALVARAADGAPAEELLPRDALGRCATLGVAMLDDWLRRRFADPGADDAAPPEIATLLGLGPGLTPSGDDFLGGALIALAALGRNDARTALAARMFEFAGARTGIVSRAHLDCAADGMGAEALHDVLAALLTGRAGDLPERLAALGHVGHTSGWDALAGAVVVLRHERWRP